MKNYKCWPKFVPRSLNYPDIPVFQILRSTAAKYPFRIAIIFDAMEITYSELLTLCRTIRCRPRQPGDPERRSSSYSPSQLSPICHRLLRHINERGNFSTLQPVDGG